MYELCVDDRQSTTQCLDLLHELSMLHHEFSGKRCGICTDK